MPKELKDVPAGHSGKRYGHDMSMIRKFSSACGQLLPVYYDFLYPGDKVKCNTEMFTQVTNIVSPAMLSLTEHVDWFFVPLNQLFSTSKDNFFGIQDYHSNWYDNTARETDFVIPALNMHIFKFIHNYMSIQQTHTYSQISSNEQSLPYSDSVDEFGVPHGYNVARLSELLGLSNIVLRPLSGEGGSPNMFDSYSFNPAYILAYQKIFFDHYRITDRTANEVNFYNIDKYWLYGNLLDNVAPNPDEYGEVSELLCMKFLSFFKMRYRPFRRDYFQVTKVAPLIDFGGVGMQPNDNSSSSLAHISQWLVGGGQESSFVSSYRDLSVYGRTGSTNFTENTARLRTMFAAEKIMEITRRAAKRYDAQVAAHFGFDVPRDLSGESFRLGSEKSIFQVNEVVSMASTDSPSAGNESTPLGQRGGKAAAYKSSGNDIKFTAPCHGILMAIYSAVPESDYKPLGIDKLLTRYQREDFFLPENDKLGMQPLFHYESFFSLQSSSYYNPNSIIGWQYRFMESKLKYNVVNGAFNTKYKDWTVTRNLADAQTSPFFDNLNFYVYPQMLDNILQVHFQSASDDLLNYNGCYARDYLLHWFKFNVFKTSEMSTYGLPSL